MAKIASPARRLRTVLPVGNHPRGVKGFDRSLAVIIGIDTYTNGVPKLSTPVADAESVAKVLGAEHGFETLVVTNRSATSKKLVRLIARLQEEIGPNDRLLFYFAGHGTAIESRAGPKGFLLPQDASVDSATNYLPMAELYKGLNAITCRHMLVILDCCFAGAMRWSGTRHIVPPPDQIDQEQYSWFIQDRAWQAIASAAHDEEAQDFAAGEPLGKRDDSELHSPFAAALLNGLMGAADRSSRDIPADGVITATDLFAYVQERLRPNTKEDSSQRPILWPLEKHAKGEYIFLAPGQRVDLPPAPALDPDANPWRGRLTYEQKDADVFFGRRQATEVLLMQLEGSRFVAVTGPSHCGKSSLVAAGLLPRLPKGRDIVAMLSVATHKTIFEDLTKVLEGLAEQAFPPPGAEEMQRDTESLARWVRSRKGSDVLLIIDQAERLFEDDRDDTAATFINLLRNALDHTETGFRLVIVTRSCSEAQLRASSIGGLWETARYEVPVATQDQVRRIIEGPAAARSMRFESEEFVDRIVNEAVGRPGTLPLLSLALSEMYGNYLARRGTDRTLSTVDFEALGDSLAGPLGRQFESVLARFEGKDRLVARRIVERFVSPGARRVHCSELMQSDPVERHIATEVLRSLDGERLVVATPPSPVTTPTPEVKPPSATDGYLELSDPRLAATTTLATWNTGHDGRTTDLRQLSEDAQEWSARPAPRLLWSDLRRLRSVRRLQKADLPGLSQNERRFADASIRKAVADWTKGIGVAAAGVLLCIVVVILLLGVERRRAEQLLAHSRVFGENDEPALALATALEALSNTFSLLDQPLRSEVVEQVYEEFFRLRGGTVVPGGIVEEINTVDFAPDGSGMVVGYSSGRVSLFGKDVRAEPIKSWNFSPVEVYDVAFFYDSKRIAVGLDNGVRVIEPDDSVTIVGPSQNSAAIRVVPSRTGVLIASYRVHGNHQNEILVQTLDGTPSWTLSLGDDVARNFEFSPDGKRFLAQGFDKFAVVATEDWKPVVNWDRDDLEAMGILDLKPAHFIDHGRMMIPYHEKNLAVGVVGRVWVVDFSNSESMTEPGDDIDAGGRDIEQVAISPNGWKFLVMTDEFIELREFTADGDIVEGGVRLPIIKKADPVIDSSDTPRFEAARFSVDGKHVVAVTSDNRAKVWDLDGLLVGVFYPSEPFLLVQRTEDIKLDMSLNLLAVDGVGIRLYNFQPPGVRDVPVPLSFGAPVPVLASGEMIVESNRLRHGSAFDLVSPDASVRPIVELEKANIVGWGAEPTSGNLILVKSDGTVELRSLDGKVLADFSMPDLINAAGYGRADGRADLFWINAAVSADGRRVAVITNDGDGFLFDASGVLVEHFDHYRDSKSPQLEMSADGSVVINSMGDGRTFLWRDNGDLEQHGDAYDGRRFRLTYDGRFILNGLNRTTSVERLDGTTILGPVDHPDCDIWYAFADGTGARIGLVCRPANSESADVTEIIIFENGAEVDRIVVRGSDSVEHAAFDEHSDRVLVTTREDVQVWSGGSRIMALDLPFDGTMAIVLAEGRKIAGISGAGTQEMRIWTVYDSPAELVSAVRAALPLCLSSRQRNDLDLAFEMPAWCQGKRIDGEQASVP